MATLEFTFDPRSILKPAQPSTLNRTAPVKLGPSLTLAAGQAIARKVADGLFYALNTGASDGTQIFGGFLQAATATDASGNHYAQTGAGAGSSSPFTAPSQYATAYTGGVFDPSDVVTNATSTAEVDTFTPAGTITTGDVYTLRLNVAGVSTAVSFTVAGTTTAAAVSAGLIAAWNGNATTAAVATASGTSTVVLTATAANSPMNVNGSVVGVGTISKALTTPSTGRAIADILAGCPGARVLQPTGFWEVP